MKKRTKIILASAVAIGTAAAVVALVSYNNMKQKKVVLPRGFTVTAHTGCENTEDNSLEAIRKGYESGADIVEFDLNFTSDGTPVLAHDEAESDSVTLDSAFALIAEKEGLYVNVDCKKTDNLTEVSALAEKYGIKDRIFYTGIEEKDVDAVRTQTPDVTYWLNLEVDKSKNKDAAYLNSLCDKVIKCGAVGINMNHRSCSEELTKVFHERGLLVSIWTVNSEYDMVKTLGYGADNITTRKPAKLKSLIELKTE